MRLDLGDIKDQTFNPLTLEAITIMASMRLIPKKSSPHVAINESEGVISFKMSKNFSKDQADDSSSPQWIKDCPDVDTYEAIITINNAILYTLRDIKEDEKRQRAFNLFMTLYRGLEETTSYKSPKNIF